jgi:hypothetical protein
MRAGSGLLRRPIEQRGLIERAEDGRDGVEPFVVVGGFDLRLAEPEERGRSEF